MDTKSTIKQRTLKGVVVSNKMEKTIVVRVDRVLTHPKYGKRYTQNKRYKVHDAKNQYQVGDQVLFRECRPLSKEKRWLAVGLVSKNSQV